MTCECTRETGRSYKRHWTISDTHGHLLEMKLSTQWSWNTMLLWQLTAFNKHTHTDTQTHAHTALHHRLTATACRADIKRNPTMKLLWHRVLMNNSGWRIVSALCQMDNADTAHTGQHIPSPISDREHWHLWRLRTQSHLRKQFEVLTCWCSCTVDGWMDGWTDKSGTNVSLVSIIYYYFPKSSNNINKYWWK